MHCFILNSYVTPIGINLKVLSLAETIKEKGPSLQTSIFPLLLQVVREPLPFAYD